YPCCKGPVALLALLEGLLVSQDRVFGTYQGLFATQSHAMVEKHRFATFTRTDAAPRWAPVNLLH
ncbi:unnamed protein product, partial [Ceratitis capitata]